MAEQTMDHGETHAGEEGHTGFPPFHAPDFSPQLVWLGLSFIVLYVIMAKIALPRLARVIEARRDKIADDLDTAAALKAEADAALKAYEAALEQARAKAQAIAAETREKLQAETERLKKDVDAKLAAQIEAAEAQINATKNAALGNLKSVATEVTGVIISHLMGESANPAAIDEAVEAELKGR